MGELAKPVVGMLMPFFSISCRENSLSRDWATAADELMVYTPILSNCLARAQP